MKTVRVYFSLSSSSPTYPIFFVTRTTKSRFRLAQKLWTQNKLSIFQAPYQMIVSLQLRFIMRCLIIYKYNIYIMYRYEKKTLFLKTISTSTNYWIMFFSFRLYHYLSSENPTLYIISDIKFIL
jgi:hypothetical protein